jgi:hypothetical protein
MEFIVWLAKIDPVTLFVFLFVTLAVTEGLKRAFIKRALFCELLEIGFFKVLMSWAIAAPVFFALHLVTKSLPVKTLAVTGENIFRCFLWILMLNGGYKVYTMLKEMVKA